MEKRQLTLMVWFILLVWAGMVAADIFVANYNPPAGVYGIPTLIVGALAFLIRRS